MNTIRIFTTKICFLSLMYLLLFLFVGMKPIEFYYGLITFFKYLPLIILIQLLVLIIHNVINKTTSEEDKVKIAKYLNNETPHRNKLYSKVLNLFSLIVASLFLFDLITLQTISYILIIVYVLIIMLECVTVFIKFLIISIYE